MGPDQYVDHTGMRDGASMSGPLLWKKSEDETISDSGTMVNSETNLLRKSFKLIAEKLCKGVRYVELGPGTVAAFCNKTLLLMRETQSRRATLVDDSSDFLKKILGAATQDLEIEAVNDNFFETEFPYVDDEAVVCSFGSTISNFEGPISKEPPEAILAHGLATMANAAKGGWLLVGFDSDDDGEHLVSFYKRQKLFQLNLFFRIEAELKDKIEGDYDPKAFDYEPEWIPESRQLAHVAVVKRDMNFTLAGHPISLKEGQKLHIKNSFKYTPEFFEKCARLAGLELIGSWLDESKSKIYLLKILPKHHMLSAETRPSVGRHAATQRALG
jgi:uncharacterized SAM-dependent methyltransferase